jgi:hypothetical protein
MEGSERRNGCFASRVVDVAVQSLGLRLTATFPLVAPLIALLTLLERTRI